MYYLFVVSYAVKYICKYRFSFSSVECYKERNISHFLEAARFRGK